MALTTALPDLGLDLRKVPDLTDPKTRKRLSHAAIEVFFRIIEVWEIRNEDAMALLGGHLQRKVLRAEEEPPRDPDPG